MRHFWYTLEKHSTEILERCTADVTFTLTDRSESKTNQKIANRYVQDSNCAILWPSGLTVYYKQAILFLESKLSDIT